MRLRFAGFGGQGVVLCGYIIGKAAMLDGKSSIHTQSYGSASRGGLTKSDVAVEDGEIYDLVSDELDVLVVMSQQSHDTYVHALKADGSLFFETDLVAPAGSRAGHSYGIHATDLAAKELGRKIMANMLMIGFVNHIAGLVSDESLLRTLRETVPPGTEELNLKALELGRRHALAALESETS